MLSTCLSQMLLLCLLIEGKLDIKLRLIHKNWLASDKSKYKGRGVVAVCLQICGAREKQ